MLKAMAATWNDMEAFKLVKIWGEAEIQALLEGCTCNKAVYKKIARGILNSVGVPAVGSFAVSSEKSWRATANARKSLRRAIPPQY